MNRTECACPRVCSLTAYDTFVDRIVALNDTDSEITGRLLMYFTEKRYLVSNKIVENTFLLTNFIFRRKMDF